ncbi:MAG: MBL fold metallo-hydrolase [Betaproteobacteria bacterium]
MDRGLRDLIRFFRTPRAPWPAHVRVEPRAPAPLASGAAAVLTFVGHSTFVVRTADATLLTDPVYARRASPVSWAGPKRVRPPGVPFELLPPLDVVLVSHNHYDHLDLPTLRRINARFQPLFVTAAGNGRLLGSAGLTRIVELDWWETATVGAAQITMTPARHFSARTPFDRNRALWGSFVVRTPAVCVYFAADSGYGPHFREIAARLGAPDAALLPIGAYEPRWFMQPIHMNPEEAVRAHLDLGARLSVAMHFGTFQLTPEPIDAPVAALRAVLDARGIPPETFRAPEFGESIQVGASRRSTIERPFEASCSDPSNDG